MSVAPDYRALGFRCGLEIHQQLATSKLFCGCSSQERPVDDARPDFQFVRRLRPTQSELGEVDAAARAEAARSKRFDYLGFEGLSCLVEADEEPPHAANGEALDVALTMAILLGARPVDEVEWMRKIVIDGSNTSGFQRTGLVALGGTVDGVGIQAIALEEDSARRVGEADGAVRYGLDRLGIPLVEISTEPTLKDPTHARKVAARIGSLLRATGRVKRGIGTIRQDLNVSIASGTRIEVKGVQELNSIPAVIEKEVRRQLRLVEIRDELRRRRVSPDDFRVAPVDLSETFRASPSKLIGRVLGSGGAVLGVRVRGAAGLLGAKATDTPRLGRELADYVRQETGVRDLLHGDELPGLGITEADVTAVRRALGCDAQDGFVLVAEAAPRARRALEVVLTRMMAALAGVPSEVRAARPDDSTAYQRPMPGAARMYPETDVPPIRMAEPRMERLRKQLPELPEAKVERLIRAHGLSQEMAHQIVEEGKDPELEALATAGADGTLVARTLLATLPALLRKYPDARIEPYQLAQALAAQAEGRLAKEGLPSVLEAIAAGSATDVGSAIARLGLGGVGEAEVQAAADRLVRERADFVRSRGPASVGPLMGPLMKAFRGKVDGKVVSRCLEAAVRDLLARPPS